MCLSKEFKDFLKNKHFFNHDDSANTRKDHFEIKETPAHTLSVRYIDENGKKKGERIIEKVGNTWLCKIPSKAPIDLSTMSEQDFYDLLASIAGAGPAKYTPCFIEGIQIH